MRHHAMLKLPTKARKTIPVGLGALALAVSLCACPSGPKPSSVETPFVIKTIGLKGTTTAPATVAVDQQGDQDRTADQGWNVAFVLDGGTRASSLPVDAGNAQTLTLDARASDTADGSVSRVRATIELGQ